MKTLSPLLCLATLAVASLPAQSNSFYSEASEACYQQTLALHRGADPAELDGRVCDRALTEGPHTDAHRSAMLHNRAMIEIAQGHLELARASLEQAVSLAETPGPQHVALAQLAASTGDKPRAAELYRELAGAQSKDPLIADNRDLYRRNYQLLSPTNVANTKRQTN